MSNQYTIISWNSYTKVPVFWIHIVDVSIDCFQLLWFDTRYIVRPYEAAFSNHRYPTEAHIHSLTQHDYYSRITAAITRVSIQIHGT